MRNERYDLVIASVFPTPDLARLAVHFKCPLAVYSPTNMRDTGLGGKSGWWQQIFIHIEAVYQCAVGDLVNQIDLACFNILPRETDVSVAALSATSLVLKNDVFEEDKWKCYPRIVPVGGLQVYAKVPPLPGVLQEIMDCSVQGVIYWSFGTTAKLDEMPRAQITAIIEALGELLQRVIVKAESLDFYGRLPDNMLVADWLPQRSILGKRERERDGQQ